MEQFESTQITGWQPAETAPKDSVIIACFEDCPIPVTTTWNEPEQHWVFSLVDVNLYQGKRNDIFFQTEYKCADALKAWMPIPELRKENKITITTDELGLERLLNVNEITSLMGVDRSYFSQKIVKKTNFLEIAPPIRLYGNGAPKYQLKDVLKFIESRKEQATPAN